MYVQYAGYPSIASTIISQYMEHCVYIIARPKLVQSLLWLVQSLL